MNVWISESNDLMQAIGTFLTSKPALYIVGCVLLIVACSLFKQCVR